MWRPVLEEARVLVVAKESGVTSEDVARDAGRKLVHRIDKGTSGLLVLADDARTVQRLQRALQRGEVERTYRFVAHGAVAEGRRETTLVRDRGDGKRGSGSGGKRALATFDECVVRDDVTGAAGALTYGRATLVTGRTHQLRIQLAEEGHPIVGDRVYGERVDRDTARDHALVGAAPPLNPVQRLMLHAERLAFVHPNTHERVVVVDEAPAGFRP